MLHVFLCFPSHFSVEEDENLIGRPLYRWVFVRKMKLAKLSCPFPTPLFLQQICTVSWASWQYYFGACRLNVLIYILSMIK